MRPLVLIVDDTPMARATLRRIIEPAGFHICEAESTADAIRVYREEWPDVVTMDMLMDRHNGLVAIQALKQLDHQARIVVCSATSDPSFVTGATKLGIEGYMTKPVDPERLVRTLRAALEKGHDAREGPS